jgi:NADH-quinone oxidoreductase subunit G
MGALTLKSFPFELRGWDIEKFESLDPTDGFGRNTKVYISKQQIVQIEPEYDCNINNNWLSDKGRQFFDGIFGACDKNQNKITTTKEHSWKKAFKILSQTFYLFDHLTNKQQIHFTIIFGNVDIETLSLLSIISHNYSFITIKYSETIKLNNDLESTFQLNSGLTEKKLNSSDLCLLIGNNPRYESYSLNLELKQRFFKGNFKCLNLGSLINLTFSSMFLGTNFNILKTIIEGNNFIQSLRYYLYHHLSITFWECWMVLLYHDTYSKRSSKAVARTSSSSILAQSAAILLVVMMKQVFSYKWLIRLNNATA